LKAFYNNTKSEITKLKMKNDAPNAEMDADLLLICDPWVEGDKLMLILYLQRMIMIVTVNVFMM
jgi:hypothetical protein